MTLLRRWLAAVAVVALATAPASAQFFTVTNLADSGAGSLRQAIIDANSYSASSAATAINFQTGLSGTITLSSGMLPVITQTRGLTITGAGSTITIDGNSSSATTGDRVFFFGVNADDNTGLTATTNTAFGISNLTIANGNARGGAGGPGVIFRAGGAAAAAGLASAGRSSSTPVPSASTGFPSRTTGPPAEPAGSYPQA